MASTPTRRIARALALLAFALVLPAGLSGQEGKKTRPPSAPPQPGDSSLGNTPAIPDAAPHLVTLDFPGGTLSAYVNLLRDMFDVNAVVAPDASELPMPPLSLKKVSMGTAMNLVEAMSRSLSGDTGAVSVNTLSDPEGNSVFIVDLKGSVPQPMMQAPIPGIPGQSSQIPRRMVRGAGGGLVPVAPPSAQPVRTLQVFSIKVLTQPISGRNDLAMPPDNVLTAIDTALALSPGEETAQVKYHPETGLIFVHGTPGQLEAVGTLIRTLNEDQTVLRKSAPPADDDLLKVVDKLRAENENLRAQIASMVTDLNDLKARVGLGSPRGASGLPQPTPRSEPSKN